MVKRSLQPPLSVDTLAVGMGRTPTIRKDDDFLPGTSPDDLRRLMRQEKDPKNLKKYLAAYNRKAGRTIKEIAEMLGETYETVRRWMSAMEKGGLGGIPRRIAKGADRLLTRQQRIGIVKDAHKGPRALGYETDVWTLKDLWLHVMKKHGIKMGYSTAVRNFHEMGIVLKTPRPRHPKAASEEERAEFQRDARREIQRGAHDGFIPIFTDEAHLQAYGNSHKTVGLRGVELIADSSVERARLTVFGGVGDGFVYLMDAESGNGSEFIKFCKRLFELFGKVILILDYASYHVSDAVEAFAKENGHRLRRVFTLKYTPNDNAAETQWPAVKAAIANKQIQSRGHIAATISKAVEAGEVRPVRPHSYARVASRRVGREEAAAIKAKIGKGEHFCYEEAQFSGRVRIPTAEDLKREKEAVLPPERRAMLPRQLARSKLPDKFLANPPAILLAK